MRLIDKLKQIIYKFCIPLFETTYGVDNKHKSITQEEADALYDLIDSYTDDDLGK